MLVPTPAERLCDSDGRPYFLWDSHLTMEGLIEKLHSNDENERLYWVGVVLRQAKPDDAIVLLGKPVIRSAVPKLRGRLGRMEPLWVWLVQRWETLE